MREIFGILLLMIIILSACQDDVEKETSSGESNVEEISFYTEDSIKIFGDLYELDKQGTVILFFHQGGSNARGEYASIIPKLLEKGFNILAIDQRMGGQIYGNYNRTIANIPDNGMENDYSYCDALNNLEGALDFVLESGFSGKKILWGSSYSASLAIQLGDKRQGDVNGILAFSPASGGPMQECRPDKYFSTLKVPLLILRPPNEMESENAKEQFEMARKSNHQTYAAKYGTHGSSMLVKERVGNEVDETWEIVESFLGAVGNR